MKIFLPLFIYRALHFKEGLGRHHRLQTVIWLSTIAQKSQQSASKWRDLAFYRVASPFPILHSPFPIPHSPFAIRHSPFSILHSPFPIPHSPFPIPHSPFPIPHSSFPNSHSSIPIPHSPLRRLERVFRCSRARNLHQDARVS